MFSASLYFDTDQNVSQQLLLLEPLLRVWVGDGFMQHYRPDLDHFSYRSKDDALLVIVQRNVCHGQGVYESDRFRYVLELIDKHERCSHEENLARMTAALEALWAKGIPTCTPGKAEELPNAGGEDGPIPWPTE